MPILSAMTSRNVHGPWDTIKRDWKNISAWRQMGSQWSAEMTVEKFFDLLKPDGDIGVMQQQNNAILLFPNLVNRTRMTIWRPSMPIYKGSLRILVGVAAAYSTSDMELMDRLSEIRMIIADDIRFDVFDVGSCKSMEEIDNYIPGIGKVYQTPLVGIWEYGVITRKASGAAARDLVSSVVGHNL